MGGEEVHQHMCEREAELENMQKDVDDLKKYPVVIATLIADVGHMKTSMDTMCNEVQKLNKVLERVAVTNLKQEQLEKELTNLIKVLQDGNSQHTKCKEDCDKKMDDVHVRISKAKNDIEAIEKVFDDRLKVVETYCSVVKWGAVIVATATILWVLSNIGSIWSHVFPKVI